MLSSAYEFHIMPTHHFLHLDITLNPLLIAYAGHSLQIHNISHDQLRVKNEIGVGVFFHAFTSTLSYVISYLTAMNQVINDYKSYPILKRSVSIITARKP